MAEANIVIKATDKYSDVLRSMSRVTKDLSKDSEALGDVLHDLAGEKAVLKAETERANQAMKAAQKQFAATHDEADGMKAALAGQEYEDWRRKLDAVNKTMKQTERQLQSLNGITGGSQYGMFKGIRDGIQSVKDFLVNSGIADMVGDFASEAAGTLVSSIGGTVAGDYFSSALSSAAQGAAIGSALPVPGGTLIGGAAGAALGLATGGVHQFQAQDEAFKQYYAGLYDTVSANTTEDLSSGKTLAAQREATKISFTTLLGDEATADAFLGDVLNTANTTPFLYDDLVEISRTLLNFGTAVEDIIPTLTAVGDAGAALGLGMSDIGDVAVYLGRMQSTDRATREFLDPLNDRGLSVYQWLAEDQSRQTGQEVAVGDILDKISRGEFSGGYVSDLILSKFQELYSGQMDIQSKATEGLESTLQGLKENIQAAGGGAYNEARKSAYSADIAAYDGALGKALSQVSAAGGEAKAYGENLEDQYLREALGAVLLGEKTTVYRESETEKLSELRTEYAAASATYNNAEADQEARMQAADKMERLKEEAEALAQAAYDSSGWSQKLVDAEVEQIDAINALTQGLSAATDQLKISNARSKGMGGIGQLYGVNAEETEEQKQVRQKKGFSSTAALYTLTGGDVGVLEAMGYYDGNSHAFGLKYVPFDGYPAILHQGERVLTAAESRSLDGAARERSLWNPGLSLSKTAEAGGDAPERTLDGQTLFLGGSNPAPAAWAGPSIENPRFPGGTLQAEAGPSLDAPERTLEASALSLGLSNPATAAWAGPSMENPRFPGGTLQAGTGSSLDAPELLRGFLEEDPPGGGISRAAADGFRFLDEPFPLPAGAALAESGGGTRGPERAGASSGVNITVEVTGNTVRSQDDLDELVERFAEALEEKATLFGG